MILAFGLILIFSVVSQAQNVALVIGGVQALRTPFEMLKNKNTHDCFLASEDYGITQLTSAEIFGCPGEESILIADYPTTVQWASGIFWEARQEPLVCGGINCYVTDYCANYDYCAGEFLETCYTWNAASNTWSHTGYLINAQSRFHMGQITSPAEGWNKDPIVLGGLGGDPDGYEYECIYDTAVLKDDTWIKHKKWPDFRDYSVQSWGDECMTQIDNEVYVLNDEYFDNTTVTNLETWETRPIFEGQMDDAWQNCNDGCFCVPMEKGGKKGIYLQFGAWLNLEDERVEYLAPPTDEFNKIDGLNGLPTAFGPMDCVDLEGCYSTTRVEQYDIETDSWKFLGDLAESRYFATVVEIPDSVCSLLPKNGNIDSTTTFPSNSASINGPFLGVLAATLASMVG